MAKLGLNFVFIPTIGIYGAAIGTMISFAIMWILRVFDTKKNANIRIKKITILVFLIPLQIVVAYQNIKGEYLIQIGLFLTWNRNVDNSGLWITRHRTTECLFQCVFGAGLLSLLTF